MKTIVVAALIAGLSSVPGVAEVIDLSTQTCRQFQTSSADEIKIILAWLDGYYARHPAGNIHVAVHWHRPAGPGRARP